MPLLGLLNFVAECGDLEVQGLELLREVPILLEHVRDARRVVLEQIGMFLQTFLHQADFALEPRVGLAELIPLFTPIQAPHQLVFSGVA